MSELWTILRNLGIERKYCIHSTFSLENGRELLEKYFQEVEMREYVDSLYIDNLEDLYYYMESLPSVQDSGTAFEKRKVLEYLESVSDENGGILLPKRWACLLEQSEGNYILVTGCPVSVYILISDFYISR